MTLQLSRWPNHLGLTVSTDLLLIQIYCLYRLTAYRLTVQTYCSLRLTASTETYCLETYCVYRLTAHRFTASTGLLLLQTYCFYGLTILVAFAPAWVLYALILRESRVLRDILEMRATSSRVPSESSFG